MSMRTSVIAGAAVVTVLNDDVNMLLGRHASDATPPVVRAERPPLESLDAHAHVDEPRLNPASEPKGEQGSPSTEPSVPYSLYDGNVWNAIRSHDTDSLPVALLYALRARANGVAPD